MKKCSPKVTKILTTRTFVYILLHAAYIRNDSSQDRLAYTLACLPDTRKSTSDLISLILACYDLKKKKKKFCMTVKPSYGRKGGGFQMKDGPSYSRERVNKFRQQCDDLNTLTLLSNSVRGIMNRRMWDRNRLLFLFWCFIIITIIINFLRSHIINLNFFFFLNLKVPAQLDPVMKTDVMRPKRYQPAVTESHNSYEISR